MVLMNCSRAAHSRQSSDSWLCFQLVNNWHSQFNCGFECLKIFHQPKSMSWCVIISVKLQLLPSSVTMQAVQTLTIVNSYQRKLEQPAYKTHNRRHACSDRQTKGLMVLPIQLYLFIQLITKTDCTMWKYGDLKVIESSSYGRRRQTDGHKEICHTNSPLQYNPHDDDTNNTYLITPTITCYGESHKHSDDHVRHEI